MMMVSTPSSPVAVYTKQNKKVVSLSKLRRLGHRPDLKVGAVLFQHRLAVVLPELLGGVLAGDALEDLGASGVLFEEVCGWGGGRWLESDGMEGGEGPSTGDVVDAVVDDDVHAGGLVLVGGDVGLGEGLGHGGGWWEVLFRCV